MLQEELFRDTEEGNTGKFENQSDLIEISTFLQWRLWLT